MVACLLFSLPPLRLFFPLRLLKFAQNQNRNRTTQTFRKLPMLCSVGGSAWDLSILASCPAEPEDAHFQEAFRRDSGESPAQNGAFSPSNCRQLVIVFGTHNVSVLRNTSWSHGRERWQIRVVRGQCEYQLSVRSVTFQSWKGPQR